MPISEPSPSRPRYEPYQYLTAEALTAEQRFHLAAERRHRITAHDWGVVRGLVVEDRGLGAEGEAQGANSQHFVLTEGYAVDGFGRDLLLTEPFSIDDLFARARFQHPTERRFSVQLNYGRQQSNGCALRLNAASDGTTEAEIIQTFKMEFESKKQECAVLIVRAPNGLEKLTIAGFSDAGRFRSVVIDDPSHELFKELKKEPANQSGIVELAASSLGHIRSTRATLWAETPYVTIVPAAEFVKPTPLRPEQEPPDDPAVRFPVLLGELKAGDGGGWLVEATQATRREAGIVASEIRDPENRTCLSLREGFSLFLPTGLAQGKTPENGREQREPAEPAEAETPGTGKDQHKRLSITQNETRLLGTTYVEGTVAIDRELLFEKSNKEESNEAQPTWSIYRSSGEAKTGDLDELRLVLPTKNAAFVITAWSEEDENPKDLLSVHANGTVTVHGDLVVEGLVEVEPSASLVEQPSPTAPAAVAKGGVVPDGGATAAAPKTWQDRLKALLAVIKGLPRKVADFFKGLPQKLLAYLRTLPIVRRHPWLASITMLLAGYLTGVEKLFGDLVAYLDPVFSALQNLFK